jgi:serine/threonine protein kinase/TolB-like protein/Tfp pilus assembly protein PilF
MTASHNETIAKVCPECGGLITPEAPRGFCTICLFKTGLGDSPDGNGESVAAVRIASDFGDYELREEIGRGAQGVVYRARQKSLNRTVALKIISLGSWASDTHLKRFRLEAETAAGLNHPSIVPIHEIGEREGCCYFSMNFVDGKPLDEVVAHAPMSVRQAAQLMAKLARTIHYAHEHGILHRDIKPGNILLDEEGEPHLTDFGLARLAEKESNVTRTTEALGTPSYMAPEQARGDNATLTRAADIYSLGAVFYHLLTGRPPFLGGTAYETVRLLLETEPRQPRLLNPKVDRDLSTICLKCLEKDPQRRYASALALAEDLERWLRHEPILGRRTDPFTRGKKWVQRNPAMTFAAVSLVGLLAAVGLIILKTDLLQREPTTGIAVLPFDNLSENKDDALLAVGIQDDILTKLAKVAGLKVISRTSVTGYHGARNVPQIGRALNVSHVLEGSVRRNGNKIHLNTQLIDTRTDRHVWAEEYDRELNDVFAIQSQIVKDVAEQLHAKLSGAEKSAIDRAPTSDITAFDLYTRAKNTFLVSTNSNSGKEDLLEAAHLLNQALARDRSYFEAYGQLAGIHDLLYILGHDHSPRRLALAEAAVEAALRLRPDAGEAHLARATHLYSSYLNYDAALSELELARKSLTHDSRLFELAGLIKNRQGKFEKALPELENAMELDPRNLDRLQEIAGTYWILRRYAEAGQIFDRALAIDPNNVETRTLRADLDVYWRGDPRALHELIDWVRENNPRALHQIADSWLFCALCERDVASARAALIAAGENAPMNSNAIHFNRAFAEGIIARLEKDEARAQTAFMAARTEQVKIVDAEPDYGPPLLVLGVIDAALGRKEDAVREGRRAMELLPVEKDAINGAQIIGYFGLIAAWVGEKDLACEKLAATGRLPAGLTYGELKLHPFWDSLRGDPRFEQIVESLAPK